MEEIEKKQAREVIEQELRRIPREAKPFAVLRIETKKGEVFYGADAEVKGRRLFFYLANDIQETVSLFEIASIGYLSSLRAVDFLNRFKEQLTRSTAIVQRLAPAFIAFRK